MMLYLYVVYVAMLTGLLGAGLVEQRRHEAHLRRIPVRVHVNGIRGKSSTTRLCAGALRSADLSVVAKTTGSAARFLWPDGTEEPVRRKFGIANVIEQIGIVRQAAAERPDALVLECMAVKPDLQKVTQDKIVQATITVIGNVREDHLEEMGPTLDDVARSLALTMPRDGVCVTAEVERLDILRDEAHKRSCRLVTVDPRDVTDAEMEGFSHFTFKENVALALAVADELGVSRESALAGMYVAAPDPGVLTVEECRVEDRLVRFANIMAANDPQSTLMNVESLLATGAIRAPIFTLINCRPDRIERNSQMGALVGQLHSDKLFLIGRPTRSAHDAVPPGWRGEVIDLGGQRRSPESIWAELVAHVDGEASVLAVGNIHGQGERLLEHLDLLGVRA
jgi:gamma-polyglutamate synthase